MFGVHPNSHSR